MNISWLSMLMALPAALLMGLVLFVVGWRGRRVDDHPVCRKCRYDLSGLPKHHDACPECGANLRRPRAIRQGNRKPRPIMTTIGGGLTLLATAVTITVLVGVLGNVNWNPYKPLWLLRSEAKQTAANSAEPALEEIRNRLVGGQLSTQQREQLLDDVLHVQADTSLSWLGLWADLFMDLHQTGVGSAQQYEQFARSVYKYTLHTRPRIRQGDALPLSLKVAAHRGHGGMSTRGLNVRPRTFDSEEGPTTVIIADRQWVNNMRDSNVGETGQNVYGFPVLLDQAPFDDLDLGEHELQIERSVIIRAAQGGPVVAQFPLTLTTRFELVPADAQLVQLVDDAAMLDTVRRGISRASVEIGNHFTNLKLRFNDRPAGLAYEVFVEAEGRTHPLTQITIPAGASPQSFHMGVQWPEDFEVDRIRLILRPSVEAARHHPTLTEILDGEIVLEDVEVKWPSAQPSP